MREHVPQNDRLLIIDDEPANVAVIESILRKNGFSNYTSTTNPYQALQLFSEFQPDLLILDLMMPGMDGFQVMDALKSMIRPGSYFPILVLTADAMRETKRRALSSGATDFLTKPVDAVEVVLRIKILLETRWLHEQMRDQNKILEEMVQEKTAELEEARIEILERLALAAEFRDDNTQQHTQRVGEMAGLLARSVGWNDKDVELIRRAATLHDIGKINISDLILLKPAKLSPDEYATMQEHVKVGAEILSGSHVKLLQMAEEIAGSHHERWDGTGYPNGLAGEAIPMSGRILAIADVYDALTHDRPYKEAWTREDALTEIKAQAGKQFDPNLVDVFVDVIAQLAATEEVPDSPSDAAPDVVVQAQEEAVEPTKTISIEL